MTEEQFLNTMIEYVKYDYEDDSKLDSLLAILRNSFLIFDKTRIFAAKNMQYRENIELRVPIPLLKNARSLKDELYQIVEDVYIETDDYALSCLYIKPKPIGLDEYNSKEYDVHFNRIKETIIQGIRSAKYIIWGAVAWITDNDIFNELKKKKDQGINVRIITSKEESNKYLLKELLSELDTVAVPKWGYYNRNRMHDKFCIIDFDYVMHGSYNWSNNAQKNDETLSTATDRDYVKKFMDQFIELYNEYSNS